MPSQKYPISHVLVDCENVGLNGLTDLVVKTDGTPLKFILFHNDTNKWNLSLNQLKEVGYALNEDRVELVELSIPAKMTKKQAENALDFYIAFYMGQIMPYEPFNSHCVILSKDHDYDPLVLHVQKMFGKDRCERIDSYEELSKALGLASVKAAKTAEKKKQVKKEMETSHFDLQKALEKSLHTLEKSKPATIKKLQNSLKSWFKAECISDTDIQNLIAELQKTNVLKLAEDGNKIEYK